MDSSQQSVVNEVGRFLVRIPIDATIYRGERFIAIAFDDSPTGVMPSLVAAKHGGRLAYAGDYSVMSALCHDRAQRSVDHGLLLGGQPVTPERYLAVWRKAIAEASSFDQLLLQHGLTIHAVLRGNLETMRLQTTGVRDAPFANFIEFESKYATHIHYGDQGDFEVWLDLAEPGAARDAWFASYMTPYAPPGAMTATLAIRGQAHCPASSDLFGASSAVAGV